MATSTQLKDMLTLESEPGPFISIFVPYSGVNNAEFEQLVINARRNLAQQDPKQSWRPYQAKLNHLKFPRFIRHRTLKGFAIYLGPTILRVFRLNYIVHPTSIVNDTMWIIPLIMETQFKHLHGSRLMYKNAIKNIRTHYRLANHRKLTSHDLTQIVKIAPAGLIDTLLINRDVPFKIKKILNDLAITTIGFGGRVFVLPKHDIPNQIPAAIIKRK
ncbi:hypothetical protein [Acetilactobacillus jinshanensis]|uniref:Uncharacterized protein n=1 Tax=Acetilactobacillus jinshanensis TaxID=1720083 RepID=A0A4P6ZNF8_9LACO|nr:hypothetical protein [Acetilactobacillus jinshanensis]QBP18962.1 hypothetical protein ELX58_07720 [Acetilactobacillus jinshanensis]URL60490.1 hypothetical protein HGK75_00075 [uncultured bacterium]